MHVAQLHVRGGIASGGTQTCNIEAKYTLLSICKITIIYMSVLFPSANRSSRLRLDVEESTQHGAVPPSGNYGEGAARLDERLRRWPAIDVHKDRRRARGTEQTAVAVAPFRLGKAILTAASSPAGFCREKRWGIAGWLYSFVSAADAALQLGASEGTVAMGAEHSTVTFICSTLSYL